jgi:hypothetical protein
MKVLEFGFITILGTFYIVFLQVPKDFYKKFGDNMHHILYHTDLDVHDSRNYGNFEENIKVTMKF